VQNIPCGRAQPDQNETGAEIARRFQSLDQGSHTGTVHVTTWLRFTSTRGVRLSRISRKTESRTTGEFAKSMSPERSKIVVLSWRRAEIFIVSSPSENTASVGQILNEAQTDSLNPCG